MAATTAAMRRLCRRESLGQGLWRDTERNLVLRKNVRKSVQNLTSFRLDNFLLTNQTDLTPETRANGSESTGVE
jgi:hypothetical protein